MTMISVVAVRQILNRNSAPFLFAIILYCNCKCEMYDITTIIVEVKLRNSYGK